LLEELAVPCGPLHTIPEAAEYRQVKARSMLQEVVSERGNKLTIPASPLRLSRTPGEIRGGPPPVGRHTREVLHDLLGLSEPEIEAEFAKGAAVEGRDLPSEITGS
jgi:formyl-CoA transferase